MLFRARLAFLTGHHNQGDGYVELYRRMHVDGLVGFHAPFIPAMGSATSEQLLNRSYRAGVEAVAELLNLDQRFFPRSLLAEFLKVGPDKFFKIEEVQPAAWDIGLFGPTGATAPWQRAKSNAHAGTISCVTTACTTPSTTRNGSGNPMRTSLRIPTKSAGNSERSRPPIPIEAGQGFR